ncbi:MAG: hypothetical protein GVY23_01160, partial [Spirochaetes bacterium]|nr:hypothetical protein [Spirochaetota bacterium]
MLSFDERTLDRGLAYYDEGHVADIRASDGALIARVQGTRPHPYTVVLDTERPEASYCSCPVGVTCKHLVAVVATALSDLLPPDEVAWRLEAGVEAEDFCVPEAPTDLARQQRVATENPPAADGIIDLEEQVRNSTRFLSTFGSRGRHFFGREGEERPQPPPQFSNREEGTRGRLAFVIGPRYDFHPRIDRERPVVAPVEQYRRKDGAYGRLERLSESTPTLTTDPAERRLAEHLLLFGGEAPVLAYVEELRQTGSPVFAGDISSLAGVHRAPVSMIEPDHIHANVVPVLSDTPTSQARGISLPISLDVTQGNRHLTIGPHEGVWADRGAGRSVLFSEGGALLLGDGSTLLSEVAAVMQLHGGLPIDAIARFRRLAERFPERVSIRYPQNIRLVTASPEAVFLLSFDGPSLQLSLGREMAEHADGYLGEDYHIHLTHAEPPEEAIEEASALLKVRPDHDPYSDTWYWEADDAPAADQLLQSALTLAERGFTVYTLDTAGRRRRVRRAGPLTVHISSGTDWFDLHVKSSDDTEIDSDLLLEMARQGAYHDGETLLVLDPAEAERLRKILDLTGGLGDELGRVPAADIASVDELADLADEVDADVEAVRSLVRTIRGETGTPDVPIPAGLTAELRPYQREGVRWLATLAAHGLSGCLADDMGLGKTVQALAFMLHLRAAADAGDRQAVPRAVLVVAPLSTLGNWAREATRFAPELTVAVHHGAERTTSPEALQSADLVLTSYATAVRDAGLLAELSWRLVCLDEAQFIKNPHAKTTKALKALPSDLRLCLTGTPVENLSTDLWSIVDFLVPGLLGNLSQFTRRFPKRLASGRATGNGGGGGASNDGAERLAHLRRIVSPFLLRRTKEAVAPELPARTETVLTCEMGSR